MGKRPGGINAIVSSLSLTSSLSIPVNETASIAMVCSVQKETVNRTKGLKSRRRNDDISSRLVKEKKKFLVDREFAALRSLLPCEGVDSALDVVLEAIEYIQRLESRLATRATSH